MATFANRTAISPAFQIRLDMENRAVIRFTIVERALTGLDAVNDYFLLDFHCYTFRSALKTVTQRMGNRRPGTESTHGRMHRVAPLSGIWKAAQVVA